MRRRIAVFIGEIGREFQSEFVRCLRTETDKRDYDVFIFSNFGSYTSTHVFDKAEMNIINIPCFSEFDGIISLPDTFDIDGMETQLLKKIKEECSCPVVSVRNGSKQTYRVLLDDYQTSYNLTKHFINDHKFTKICYMSGPHLAEDAIVRLNGFRDAMKSSGLVVSQKNVFEGDFWFFKSEVAIEHFLKSYDGLPEAIICGNDYMALGLCEAIKKRGYRIPEDICISGFDEIVEGQGYDPTLTTISMPTHKLAENAMNIIERVNSGERVPNDTYLSGTIKRKGSCGCNIEHSGIDVTSLSRRLIENYVDIRMSALISIDVESCIKEEDKLALLGSYFDRTGAQKGYLCLCTNDNKNNNPYSETMILRKVFKQLEPGKRDIYHPIQKDPGELISSDECKFNRKSILPESVLNNKKPSCYVINSIHHRDTTFGYIVNEIGDTDLNIFVAPFVSALAVAYDDLRLQNEYSDFTEIKKQNLIDPLTGVLNRRGYEERLSTLVREKDMAKDIITFICADMDNLKEINDNYGHLEGDFALNTVAEVFKSCTNDADICARTGGDEFSIILTSSNPAIHETFSKVVDASLSRKCMEIGKPYTIHVSIGSCTAIKEQISDVNECIKLADERMYEKKRAYKANLKT